MKPRTKAMIYDMDGVIADTQKIHSRIEAEMLSEHGVIVSPQEITLRFSGVSVQEMLEALFGERGKTCPDMHEFSERKLRIFQACVDEFQGIPGTIANIEMLYGRMPLGVASASRHSSIELVLGAVGVRERFKAVTSSKDVARGKPAPDVFLLAARRLGVEPKHCIVVEDGINGMIGAKAAGMRCIALWTEAPRELPADLVVSDMRDVPHQWFE